MKHARTPTLVTLALLALTLFAFSSAAPAFQYDEAWWGLFLHQTAEQGKAPIFGMQAYTSVIPHYPTILALKLFGPHVWVLRAIPKLEVLAGVGLISAALAAVGESLAAILFPGLVAFFPALVMNSRWSVELNTFSVLCTGLIAYGLATRARSRRASACFLFAGSLLAVLSHIFLIAPLAALWLYLFAFGHLRKNLALIRGIAGAIIVWLLALQFKDPQHLQWAILAALTFVAAAVSPLRLSEKWRKGVLALPVAVGSLLLVPLIVHVEGHWQVLQYTGEIAQPLWIGTILIPIGILTLVKKELKPLLRYFPFLPLCLLATYAIVGRVGARFLEVPFLYVAAGIALSASRLKTNALNTFVVLWIISGAGILTENYLIPCLEGTQTSRVFRLGKIMKDSSEDFLAKVPQAEYLASRGCEFRDLREDQKSIELQFMALGDWPKLNGDTCSLNPAEQKPGS